VSKKVSRVSPPALAKIVLLSKRSHMHVAFMFSTTLALLCNSDTVFLSSVFSAFQQQQQLKKLPKESLYCSPLRLLFLAEQRQTVSSAPHPSFKTTLLSLSFLPKNEQIWYCVVTSSFSSAD